MNFCLASLATKVLREKSCKVKSCVLRDARLVPTITVNMLEHAIQFQGTLKVDGFDNLI